MEFECIHCGKKQEFENAEEAFHAGWDTYPYFTIGPLCEDCPTSEHMQGIIYAMS